ncbi:tape measure protein [Devosia neptuniae]|uniref:Tape measure protein n=1 Tax=Devosia neptuniae TaxID=191302 RepID=A0ABY6CF75_9HYPH|nr:tape measure protein [Devosia neptuniae]UXN70891.1 tape measure protein [Devosia neptuniae]
MADTIQTLLVSLEARIAGYEREMKRAVGVSSRSAKSIETRFAAMNRNVSNSFNSFSRGIATAFAGAAAIRGAQTLIDASTRIENSLKVAGLSGQALTDVYDDLFKSAQRNAAPLEALVELYGRASLVQKELGVSTEELLGFTDKVAVALRVSGKSAAESSGALLQLSQTLGGGIVRAEEFNSILEGALPIAQAAAAGLEEAGGSVAKLRQLVVDGKVSSEAFFRSFEAGSSILTNKVAGAELTVSQGFIRLQNVLIDTAGKFDTATGASTRIAGVLQQLSNAIEGAGTAADANAPAINRFLDFISSVGNEFGDDLLAGTVREFEAIGSAVDSVAGSFDRYGASVSDAELATAQAEQALASFALNGASQFGALEPVVDDFIQQLLEGKGTAETAAEAINAIGAAGDFGPLIGQLGGLVSALFAVRSEAVATAAAVAAAQRGETSRTNIEGQRAEQLANRPKPSAVVKPVSLSDYKIPASDKKGSGSKTSPGEKLDDILKKQAEENRLLQEKTALQATLNPLVNDYGFAVEKLRVSQELQTAATAAGIELTPALKATIDELATGYANASVEAAKLAESQEQIKQIAADFGEAGKSAIQGFISDLREGKSAADALSNAMASILDSVIQIGINALLGGFGGGGGLLGALGGLFGFAGGGYTGAGGKNEPAGVVHRGEYVFTKAQTERLGVGNLSRLAKGCANGGYVGSPGAVSSRSQQGLRISVGVDVDNSGSLMPFVTSVADDRVAKAAPGIGGAAVRTSLQQSPMANTEYQARYGS